MTGDFHPSDSERELLRDHLAALRSDLVREFLRKHEVGPLGDTKAQALNRASAALDVGETSWAELVAYLDKVEPASKQHVFLYSVDQAALAEWRDEETAKATVERSDYADLWQQQHPLAAPPEPRLAAINFGRRGLELYAVARRTYRERREDLDARAFANRDDLEAVVYQRIAVRSWMRLEANPATGAIAVHISQLKRQDDYDEAREQFLRMVSGVFPAAGALTPIDLAKVVRELHDLEESGTPEAVAQSLAYESPVGVKSALSSARQGQSVIGQSPGLTQAASLMKASGPGASGNFYFLPPGQPATANPLTDPAHVRIIVRDNRINIPRPISRAELDYILDRIRFWS